jgi:O-methyltransferase
VTENQIRGDVVELGCYRGSSSIFIQALLSSQNSDRHFHVYDSWQGLPETNKIDIKASDPFGKGFFATSKEAFVETFNNREIKLPIIHSGWFSQIPDEEYPKEISFAFLDGDLYSSIIDSFNKIYDKLVSGARVVIDDYGNSRTPGVRQACADFLKGRPERMLIIEDYQQDRPDLVNEVGFSGGGLLIKE